MRYMTRLCGNTANWRYPTASATEDWKTFYSAHGYGHEEWLFRMDWQIGGWRYGFVQGVNRGWRGRLRRGERVADVVFYTIEEDGRRRYVARIRELEFLDAAQSAAALEHFQVFGWFDAMQAEIDEVEGDQEGLGSEAWAPHILNVRFRADEVEWYPAGAFAEPGDPVLRRNRYQLYRMPEGDDPKPLQRVVGRRKGSSLPPSQRPYQRKGSGAHDCSPEHAMMQAILGNELRKEYPKADIQFESDYIDVLVSTADRRILFEIKSDYSPRKVMRLAIGQLLEYAYYPGREDERELELVMVGRADLDKSGKEYLKRLQESFGLPLGYRQVRLPLVVDKP